MTRGEPPSLFVVVLVWIGIVGFCAGSWGVFAWGVWMIGWAR